MDTPSPAGMDWQDHERAEILALAVEIAAGQGTGPTDRPYEPVFSRLRVRLRSAVEKAVEGIEPRREGEPIERLAWAVRHMRPDQARFFEIDGARELRSFESTDRDPRLGRRVSVTWNGQRQNLVRRAARFVGERWRAAGRPSLVIIDPDAWLEWALCEVGKAEGEPLGPLALRAVDGMAVRQRRDFYAEVWATARQEPTAR